MALPALKSVSSPNYSSRNGVKTRLIVVHDCEGSFLGSVAWFAQARSQVSAHLVLSEDGTQAIQMVSWANKAWHACAFNSCSEGIESAGYAAKGLGAPEWQALANIVAFRLHANGLSPTWARGGMGAGFTQHVDLGAAGGGHHDITGGDTSVWEAFIQMVQASYALPPVQTWLAGQMTDPLPPPPADWVPIGTTRHDLMVGSLSWVQMTLNKLGMKPPLSVDGLDGPKTQAAISMFQNRAGLVADGVAGPDTIAALKKVAG